MMQFYWLIVGTLAVWRITHLLSAEDGPWNLIVWLRKKAGSGFWGNLLDCFYCLSLWVAMPFALFLGVGTKERFCLWLALSAGAIILHRVTPDEAARPVYFEDGGEENVVLRKSENAGTENDVKSSGEAGG
jgi:hypothetical protein